jgi:fibronectin type 3 domain-containing protein
VIPRVRGKVVVCATIVALAANMACSPGAGATPTSVLPAPTGLRATAVSSSEIDLTWTAVPGATSYSILRSKTASAGYALVGTSTTASFKDIKVTAATTYYYEVKAVNSSGASAPAKASATTTPRPPLGLAAKGVSISEIDLTWTGATGATSYRVLHTTVSTGPYLAVGTPTTNNFADIGLSPGVKYYYEVESVNAGGSSGVSRPVAAFTYPAPPTGVFGKAVTSTQINVSWRAVIGAASYVVNRSSTSGGPYTAVGTPHSPVFVDTGLNTATTYYYVVQAKDGAGTSANSAEVSVTTTPAAPGGLTATVKSSSQINLSWSPVTGASAYRVLLSKVAGGPYSNVGALNATTFNTIGLSPATTYYFTIQATNTSGPSARSTEVSALTDPSAPTDLKATAVSVSEIDLTWNAVTGASGYVLQRSTTSGGPYTAIGSPTSTAFADTSLAPATTYYYVIQATNASGPSGNSVEASAITMLGVPTGVVASAASVSEIDLTWNAIPGTTNYVVERSTSHGGPYTTIGTPTPASFADTGLKPATTYYYVIQATTGSVTSPMSPEASATTLLGTPTGVTANTASVSEIDLAWNAIPGANGYVVERSTTTGGPYTTIGTPTVASLADTGLRPATTYFYVVEATAGSVTSPMSPEASATTLLGTPTGVTANTASVSEIDLTWNAIPGANSYVVERSTTTGGPYTTVGTPTVASFADTALKPATTYFYVVKATAGSVSSPLSTEVSATTLLGAPAGVTANAVSSSEIDLSWLPDAGASGYVVKRSNIPGGPYSTVGSTTSTSFRDTGLSSRTTYYYVVLAVDTSGQSSPSSQVSARTFGGEG